MLPRSHHKIIIKKKKVESHNQINNCTKLGEHLVLALVLSMRCELEWLCSTFAFQWSRKLLRRSWCQLWRMCLTGKTLLQNDKRRQCFLSFTAWRNYTPSVIVSLSASKLIHDFNGLYGGMRTRWLLLSPWKILESFWNLVGKKKAKKETASERGRKEIIEHYSLLVWTTTSFIKSLHSDSSRKTLPNSLPWTDKPPDFCFSVQISGNMLMHPAHIQATNFHYFCISLASRLLLTQCQVT